MKQFGWNVVCDPIRHIAGPSIMWKPRPNLTWSPISITSGRWNRVRGDFDPCAATLETAAKIVHLSLPVGSVNGSENRTFPV